MTTAASSRRLPSNAVLNRRLAARYHQRQAALLRAVWAMADRIGRWYAALPARVAAEAVRRGFSGLSAAAEVLDAELAEIRRAIGTELEQAALRGRRTAADAILKAVPNSWKGVLAGLAAARGPVREAEEPHPWEVRYELEPLTKPGLSPEEIDAMLRELLFPAPSAEQVQQWLVDAVPGGKTWDDRLQYWERGVRAAMLNELTIGLADGENVDKLRDRLKPLADGLTWKAQRIARTEANRVAERANRAAVDGLGDLVQGMQIVAVMDEWTRPEHASRNGKIYRKQEDGTYRDDNGEPLPDLPDAPNCRCMTIPVLKEPEVFKARPELITPVKTATKQLIPDPVSYPAWWQRASAKERMTAVGVTRYQAVRGRLNRAPQWTDFIDPDGRLLSIKELLAETDEEREARLRAVKTALDDRRRLFRAVTSRTYLDTRPPKTRWTRTEILSALEVGPPEPVHVDILSRELVVDISREFFGRELREMELARLAGALNDADVLVRYRDAGLELEMHRSGVYAKRWVGKDDRGRLKIELIRFDVPEDRRRGGIAVRSVARTIKQAAELGVEYAAAGASRERGDRGYYSLARYGFDGRLPESWLKMHAESLERLSLSPEFLSDIMATDEGRRYWLEHGISLDVIMDLGVGSRELENLADYIRQRQEKGRPMAESKKNADSEDPRNESNPTNESNDSLDEATKPGDSGESQTEEDRIKSFYPTYSTTTGLVVTEEDEEIWDEVWARRRPRTEEERRRFAELYDSIFPPKKDDAAESPRE
ncbi:MAG: hypothetical protein Kow0040_14880 [Thermogutta sp.]